MMQPAELFSTSGTQMEASGRTPHQSLVGGSRHRQRVSSDHTCLTECSMLWMPASLVHRDVGSSWPPVLHVTSVLVSWPLDVYGWLVAKLQIN